MVRVMTREGRAFLKRQAHKYWSLNSSSHRPDCHKTRSLRLTHQSLLGIPHMLSMRMNKESTPLLHRRAFRTLRVDVSRLSQHVHNTARPPNAIILRSRPPRGHHSHSSRGKQKQKSVKVDHVAAHSPVSDVGNPASCVVQAEAVPVNAAPMHTALSGGLCRVRLPARTRRAPACLVSILFAPAAESTQPQAMREVRGNMPCFLCRCRDAGMGRKQLLRGRASQQVSKP